MAILLVMCDGRDLGVAVGENSRSEKPEVRSQESEGESQPSVISRPSSVGGESKAENHERHGGQRTTDNEPRTSFEPNIYLYDKYPGGIGLSEPLYRMSEQLLNNARKLIENCPCEAGCPSCVGPAGEIGEKGKEVALAILRAIRIAAERAA